MNAGKPVYSIDNKITFMKDVVSECISHIKPKTSREIYSELERELNEIIQQEAEKSMEKFCKLGQLYKLYDKLPNNYKIRGV